MTSYAYYRLPYADTYTKVCSESMPRVIRCLNDIGNEEGFVIAPFMPTEEMPAVIIPADDVTTHATPSVEVPTVGRNQDAVTSEPNAAYSKAFSLFHNGVNTTFRKLVLARTKVVEQEEMDEVALFLRACNAYPRLMIMLFSTPLTGTWIISSPEILIEEKEQTLHTIALAGTMPYNDGYAEWSEKNKEEQHIVEQYIADIITPMSEQVIKDGPYTSRAGDLQHLRTDFRFHLRKDVTLGSVITHLHPTPAVCGLPTKEAKEFIISNEGIERRYYSGFAGPVGINNEAHLYVSLRCAELRNKEVVLYAGGGIMPDSTCLSEWQETEQKMNTIKNVL